ncbi:Gfo/Idh/MocA family oxidoreductase [Vibrio mediterranei]|uniref:Gfo/Idh/MocA family protein n=1 Tax=Vibrio mediterranei TaxID=689 RepID=UPI001EFE1EB6|nr:Gfo/Idh/MocA family oxidoreductase [Vibrio mediterranei]MCG9625625.1 Gfo/Idh/MocA family oxidoreductase [Vibrio mediterranei]
MMKIGIIGAGGIVNVCLAALDKIDEITVSAICVLEQERQVAEELAEKYSIPTIYTDYNDFLADSNIDAVYVGIINSLHYLFTKQALEANKNVICEKPFTSLASESEELASLAVEKRLYLFEAITLLHFRNYRYILDKIKKLGDIKLVQCNFSQFSSRYPQYKEGNVLPAFSPELSGGALYDLNVYNIHFVMGLFGTPDNVHYLANRGHNGIDTSGVCTLQYPEFIASCAAAKDSTSPNFAIIQGEKGYIKVEGATNFCPSVSFVCGEQSETYDEANPENHMVEEFQSFARMFREQNLEQCYRHLNHSVSVMNVIEQARLSAGIVFSCDTNA